jgi:hypothetical protein
MPIPPERIYLQFNPDDPKADFDGIAWEGGDVSWSAERIGASDIEYVIAPAERLKARWKRARLS